MSFLLARHGALGGGKKVRAMCLSGGYYKREFPNWVINKIVFTGKFLTQPSCFYSNRYVNGTAPYDNVPNWFWQAQTHCKRSDGAANVNAYPEAYNFDLGKWHDYNLNCGYIDDYIVVDSTTVRTVRVSNTIDQGTATNYRQYIFEGGVSIYLKNMRVYDRHGTLKYNWDFENGDDIPAGWSNATIENVKL